VGKLGIFPHGTKIIRELRGCSPTERFSFKEVKRMKITFGGNKPS